MNEPYFTTRVVGNVQIIELFGRFDAHQVAPVKSWLRETCDSGANLILFNLKGVNFIDTRALSLLVTGMKWCQEANGALRLCGLQQPVQIIFEMTHLNRAFEISAHEAEALNSFQASPTFPTFPTFPTED